MALIRAGGAGGAHGRGLAISCRNRGPLGRGLERPALGSGLLSAGPQGRAVSCPHSTAGPEAPPPTAPQLSLLWGASLSCSDLRESLSRWRSFTGHSLRVWPWDLVSGT